MSFWFTQNTQSTGGTNSAVKIASNDPTVNDDTTQSYVQGSFWYNTTDNSLWIADSVATGAAVWTRFPENPMVWKGEWDGVTTPSPLDTGDTYRLTAAFSTFNREDTIVWNGAAWELLSAGPGGVTTKDVNQTAHGFKAGQPLCYNFTTGMYELAIAIDGQAASHYVVEVVDTDNVRVTATYYPSLSVTLADLEETTLTDGWIFLSQTAGKYTNTAPALEQPIGTLVGTTLELIPHPPYLNTVTEFYDGRYPISTVHNDDFIAQKGWYHPVDCTGKAIVVTPPTQKGSGTRFFVSDIEENSATNNITVDFTTEKIRGNATNFLIDTNGRTLEFIYINSTIGYDFRISN